ncbi:hypothetical protein TNCV_1987031 [Trichonephila clavipes]|nr:hypothetical protein TNCV_1987031 [Trichonephila clavipes]
MNALEGQKMHECEARSDDCSTSPNCSNGIIVIDKTYYSLFHTPSPGTSTISRHLAEALRSQMPLRRLPFDPSTSAESSEWSQHIILVATILISPSFQC